MRVGDPGIVSGTVFTRDGCRIRYDHYRRNHPAVVILAHGFFAGRRAVLFREMAQALWACYDVIVFDFRGHGESSGRFVWTAREEADLEAVSRLAQRAYPGRVGVIGFSLGAAVSLNAAVGRPLFQSLVAVSAPTSVGRIDARFWWMDLRDELGFNVFGAGRIGKGIRPGPPWLLKTPPIASVPRIRIPVYFLHGERDWLIRPWHGRTLFERTGAPVKRREEVPGARHAEDVFRHDPEAFIRKVCGWFAATLTDPP